MPSFFEVRGEDWDNKYFPREKEQDENEQSVLAKVRHYRKRV